MKLKTLYVHRKVLNASSIVDWAKSQQLSSILPPKEFHITQMFCKSEFDWSLVPRKKNIIKLPESNNRKISMFGDAFVIQLSSKYLQRRWKEFMDNGTTYDFSSYKPHLTVTFSMKYVPDDIEPFTGPIILGPEIYKEVNLEFKKKLKEIPLV